MERGGWRRIGIAWAASLSLVLAGCGGGGSGGGSATSGGAITTSSATTCSLRDRQDWAAAQLREWYLFPETLPASLDPSQYTTVSDYIDALTATARAQRRDRYFTYLTSIAGENAYYDSGSSAGFGIRLSTNATARTVTVTEAFENTAAVNAGIDRGTSILAIGTSAANLRSVSDIIAASGEAGVTDALGPSTAGTTRALQISNAAGQRTVTVTKTNYTLDPLSPRYGSGVLSGEARPIAYINLRTFITTAETPLRNAFAQFRAQGITDYVIDLRYNGGGLLSTAQLLGSLLGGNRAASDVFAYQTYRPEKSAGNSTLNFQPQPQSASPLRIAFITTGSTASASELVINAMVPFLHASVAIVGANTYGKPVGQIALDRAACDDRLRVVAFATANAARNADYYNGLASTVEASCSAADDVTHALGDRAETSIAAARDFLFGRSCGRIAAGGITTQSLGGDRDHLLIPDHPTAAQRDLPGAF